MGRTIVGPGARSKAPSDGFYLWRPHDPGTATLAVQSRWGNLYDARAAVRSLAVDVYGRTRIYADVAVPSDALVADRLPGRSLRLRVLDLPVAPFRGRYPVLLSLGAMTDVVSAHVALTPLPDASADGLHVHITAVVPGAVFGLSHAQAYRPPNMVKRAARKIRLLVDATVVEMVR